jgi:hypothetical protein
LGLSGQELQLISTGTFFVLKYLIKICFPSGLGGRAHYFNAKTPLSNGLYIIFIIFPLTLPELRVFKGCQKIPKKLLPWG